MLLLNPAVVEMFLPGWRKAQTRALRAVERKGASSGHTERLPHLTKSSNGASPWFFNGLRPLGLFLGVTVLERTAGRSRTTEVPRNLSPGGQRLRGPPAGISSTTCLSGRTASAEGRSQRNRTICAVCGCADPAGPHGSYSFFTLASYLDIPWACWTAKIRSSTLHWSGSYFTTASLSLSDILTSLTPRVASSASCTVSAQEFQVMPSMTSVTVASFGGAAGRATAGARNDSPVTPRAMSICLLCMGTPPAGIVAFRGRLTRKIAPLWKEAGLARSGGEAGDPVW